MICTHIPPHIIIIISYSLYISLNIAIYSSISFSAITALGLAVYKFYFLPLRLLAIKEAHSLI